MDFDLEGARRAGYDDGQIADALAQRSDFDIAGARRAGYADADIIPALMKRLGGARALPQGVTPSDAGAGRGGQGGATLDQLDPVLAGRRRYEESVRPQPTGGSVFDRALARGDEIPEPPLTDEAMEWQSLSPAKQQEIQARQRYAQGFANAPEARPASVATEMGAAVRGLTDNPVARGAVAGLSQLGQVGTGLVRAGADAVGAEGVADFARGAAGQAAEVAGGAMQGLRGNDKLAGDITSSIVNSLPAVALGTVGGPALRTLFAQSAAADYAETGSLAHAGMMGAAEALGERFGFAEQIKLIKGALKGMPNDDVAKVLGNMLAKEIPGEQATTAMQFLIDKAGPGARNPNATFEDYLKQAGETLEVTIGQTAVMGGGPALVSTTRNEMARADRATERSAMNPAERAAVDAGFVRPTERRKAADSRLDDFSAEHGISSKALKTMKEAADGKPLAEVVPFYKRFIAALARGGGVGNRQFGEADLGALDEPPPPAQPQPASQAIEAADLLDDGTGLADAPPPANSQEMAGEAINRAWSTFKPESGSLNVPREQMPQIKAEHRAALVNFLGARGVDYEADLVAADTLKPTQAEFSPKRVQQAREFTDGDRSILVSSDGYILDGHHQWLAKLDNGEPVKVIRLNAPIQDLLRLAHQFPSSTTAAGPTRGANAAGTDGNGRAEPDLVGRGGGSERAQDIEPGGMVLDAPAADGPPVRGLRADDVRRGEGDAALNADQPPANPVAESLAPGRSADGDGAVARAQGAGGRILARAGRTPTAAEPIELRANEDGTLTPWMGGYEMLDQDSGDPIRLPAGVSDLEAKQAIRKAGAVSNRTNFFQPGNADGRFDNARSLQRQESVSNLRGMDGDAVKVQAQVEPELQTVRGVGRDSLRTMGQELRGFSQGRGGEAESAASTGSDRRDERVRAGQRPLGDEQGAAAQSPQQRARNHQRRDQSGIGVGRGDEDQRGDVQEAAAGGVGAAKSVDDAKSKRVVRATSPSAPAATAVAKPSKLTPLDDPRLAQDDFRAALEQATADIGWTQRGGQLIRSGVAEAGDGDGDGGRAGAVVGRTQWLGPDLWRERPDGISEDDAKAAIRNALAGKPMTARQKRFVQYVLDRAAERVQADRDNAAENIAEDAAERAAIMAETGAGPAGMASIESEDWLDIASTDKRAGMRALGFTEKEIEDALGPEDQAQGSDEGQVARAVEERPGEGAEAGAARAEEEGGREEGLTAPQVEPAASEERAQTSVKPREKTPAEARVVALRKRVSVLESLRACLNG